MLVFLIGYSFTSTGLRTRGVRDRPPPRRRRPRRRATAAAAPRVAAAGGPAGHGASCSRALPSLFDDYLDLRPFWIGVFAQGIALAIIFLSFTLVTGEGGLISLVPDHAARASARSPPPGSPTEAGWPVWLAILVGRAGRGAVRARWSRCRACGSATSTSRCSRSASRCWSSSSCGAPRVRELRRRACILGRPFGLGITDRIEMYAIVAVVFARRRARSSST